MSLPDVGAVVIVPVVSAIDVISVFVPLWAALRLVLAPDAVVDPVPPLTTATVPVTLAAVPVVFWFSVGTSAAEMAARTAFVPLERR